MHSDSEIPPGSNRRATNAVFAGCMGIDALRLGFIGLQLHDKGMVVEYKDLQIGRAHV